ncbi:MAG TPA: hypothetical protein PLD58_07010 [Phycisphaerae bacterium]|nr:hypothetical protein [Phycisphaerae bacterium]
MRILLAILLLIVILIALAPTIVSSSWGTGMVLSQVNSRIRGQIAVRAISVGWFSPLQVDGLTITDPQGRETLNLGQMAWDRSLFNLVLSQRELGQMSVTALRVALHLDEDGGNSLQKALELREPSPPAPPEPAKPIDERLNLKLDWKQVELAAIRSDGRKYEVKDIHGSVELASLNNISAEMNATFDGGGTLTLRTTLRDLIQSGKVDVNSLRGEFKASLPSMDVSPAAEFVAPDTKTSGTLAMDCQGAFSAQHSVKLVLGIKQLASAAKGAKQTVAPADIDLTLDAKMQDKALQGTARIVGNFATVNADFTHVQGPADAAQPQADWKQGKVPPMDEFGLNADGKVDLVALSKSVPGLLKLREGVTISSGSLDLTKVTVRGGKKPFAQASAALNLTTVRGQQPPKAWDPLTLEFYALADDGGDLKIQTCKLDSSFARMNASGTLADLTAELSANLAALHKQLSDVIDLDKTIMAGNVTAKLRSQRDADKPDQTDLALAVQLAAVQYGPKPEPPKPGTPAPASQPAPTAYTADLDSTLRMVQDKTVQRLSGKVELRKLALTDTQNLLSEPQVVHYDLSMDDAQHRMDLARLETASKLLKFSLKGSASSLDTQCLLDFKGSYSLDLPETVAILKKLSPDGVKSVALLGASAGDIVISGPTNSPDVKPPFRKLVAGAPVTWQAGSKVYGLTLGDARFEPGLADALFKLPVHEVDANGGKLRLGMEVDLREEESVFRIPGKLTVLDKVGVNAEVGREILSRALPLLGQANSMEGSVTLVLEDFNLPLSDRLKKAGTGKGHMDLSSVQMRPAGEMAVLMSLAGMKGDQAYPIKVSGLDFALRDNGLWYENFSLIFNNNIDLRFRGVVRFDDTVDMFVSVPMSPSLLEGLGVNGPTSQYAKALEGMRVEIPMGGTRGNPKLDLAKVDVKGLVTEALKKIGGKGIGDMLPGVLKGGDSKSSDKPKPLDGLIPGLPGKGGDGGSKSTTQPAKPLDNLKNLLPLGK